MTDQLAYAVPDDQPDSVHRLARRLFPAYSVENGGLHLAGCSFEDRLFWLAEVGSPPETVKVYLDGDGKQVDEKLVEQLGMLHLSELEKPLELIQPDRMAPIELAARLACAEAGSEPAPSLPVVLTALWCKFVEGKIRFEIGENTVDLSFSDWAATLEPPPFVCPYTGEETFKLAATDDGRIVAAEKIETCQETGARVLADDLETCTISGRRAVKELVEACPVSGESVLTSNLVACDSCGEEVSPSYLQRGQCSACRKLAAMGKDDPRMVRILHEHPLLDRWNRWRVSETAAVYVLVASGWFRQLLAVIDKDSLELKRVATANRLSTTWNVVEPSQREHVLRQ